MLLCSAVSWENTYTLLRLEHFCILLTLFILQHRQTLYYPYYNRHVLVQDSDSMVTLGKNITDLQWYDHSSKMYYFEIPGVKMSNFFPLNTVYFI